MKKQAIYFPALVALALSGLLWVSSVGCGGQESHEGHAHAQKQDKDHEAHKDVTAPHPDVRVALEHGDPVYFCPMHPEVVSAEQGECDPCAGMQLVEHKGEVYGCPMHPDEVTTSIEAECRLCGMHLEPLAHEEPAEQSQTRPAT